MSFFSKFNKAINVIWKQKRIWLHRLQIIFIILAVGFIIYTLVQFREPILHQNWNIYWLFLVIALVILVTTILFWSIVWIRLLNQLDHTDLPIFISMKIYLLANITKYLPGFVWNYFARAYLGKNAGFTQKSIWIANIYDFIVGIIMGAFVYMISLFFPHLHRTLIAPVIIGGTLIILLIIISPPAVNIITKLIKQTTEQRNIINYRSFIQYLFFSLLAWLMIGFGFWNLIKAFNNDISFLYLPESIGIWSAAVALSMIAIIFPQGIGVKEVLLTYCLSYAMPTPQAIAIVVISRIWIIIGDILSLACWWFLNSINTYIKKISSSST